MANVNLDDQEWQWLLNALATTKINGVAVFTWAEVNPLLMKIGAQLQHQANGPMPISKPEEPKSKRQ